MNIDRRIVESFKQQIEEGKFSSNNELVTAIRELYNQARLLSDANPLLQQFLNDNNYMEFTKEITKELTDYYKEYKERENKKENISEIEVDGQKIDSEQVSQVSVGNNTYFKVKDDDGEYNLYNGNAETVMNRISEVAIDQNQDINTAAKTAIGAVGIDVALTNVDEFENQTGLSRDDHKQAAIARSMETMTQNEISVNGEHDIIFNNETGALNKIDEDGKVRTYLDSSMNEASATNAEQFVLPDDLANDLSLDDLNTMIENPERYNLSNETVEALKQARDKKELEPVAPEQSLKKGFQKKLKPPTNFRTAAFIDILLVALICFGFSALLIVRILILLGI